MCGQFGFKKSQFKFNKNYQGFIQAKLIMDLMDGGIRSVGFCCTKLNGRTVFISILTKYQQVKIKSPSGYQCHINIDTL